MITFSKLGKDGMNLGNQLHQIASLIGFSEKYQCEMVLPSWKYAPSFKNIPEGRIVDTDMVIHERNFHYDPSHWDEYAEDFREKRTDIIGFLQSEKYWAHCRQRVYEAFTFKEQLVASVRGRFVTALSKPVIGISIRRGDFVTDPNHYLLPIQYYLGALVKFFPDRDGCNIIIFSDDIPYCSQQIRHLPNIYFSTNLDAIEQLCLMAQCQHFIISNSTFSWWGAILGEKDSSVIIRPAYHFDGELLKKHDWKDYYPARWTVYDHLCGNEDVSKYLRSPVFIKAARLRANIKKAIWSRTRLLKKSFASLS